MEATLVGAQSMIVDDIPDFAREVEEGDPGILLCHRDLQIGSYVAVSSLLMS